MMSRYLSFAAVVVLGTCVLFALGAAYERMELSGELLVNTGNMGLYQPAFSGITDEGECYFAITNTATGKTELFGITEELMEKLSDKAFQPAKEGRVVIELTTK
jgi:hypothetical protein